MLTYLTFPDPAPLDEAKLAELQELAAEAIGWQSLGEGTYLHHGDVDGEENVVHVVGVPNASMVGMNVLWVV